MRPSRYQLQLFILWMAIGLLSLVANIGGWDSALLISFVFWGYFAILLLATVIDASAIFSRPDLKVDRTLEPHMALGVRQTVAISIANRTASRCYLWVTDFPPPQLVMEGLPVKLYVDPGELAQLRYSILPKQRGVAQFGRVCCRISSPWGLWQRNSYYGESQQSRIYPNYKPLFRSSFVSSDQIYADMGVQLRQRRGEGTDFRQLRDFRVGDSLRQIDWRATARFQKPISREYQDERDQQVVFLLDCGRRMRARDGDISHFDHALNALIMSAFIALRQGDSVGLLSFAGQSRWLPPVKGSTQINHMLDKIFDLECSLATSDFIEVAQQLMMRQSRRSLVIIISSLEPQDNDDLVSAVKLLSQQHLVMVASMRQQVIAQTETAEIFSIDDALKYCGVTHHREQQSAMYAQLRSNNVIVADTAPAHLHTSLISEYMSLKRSGIF